MYNYLVRNGRLLFNTTKMSLIWLFPKKKIAFYIYYVYNTYNNSVIS